MRRLDAEAVRDSMLAVAGGWTVGWAARRSTLTASAEDAAKRLFSGPLDGNGRRSIYLRMTLMEPPRFLALFNQPIPKLTAGRRDTTNVPDQALALLNDPLVMHGTGIGARRVMQDGAVTPEQRARRMFATAFARRRTSEETARLRQAGRALRRASRSWCAGGLMQLRAGLAGRGARDLQSEEFIYVQ